MFESKINRGRANGYAPLDSGSKVPLSYLPPIQSTIDTGSFATTSSLQFLIDTTGSFATTGSNTFIGEQTISTIQGTGSLYLKPDLSDNRHFEIYNTSPSDTHIKSNGGLSYFGDDINYLRIDDGADDVRIQADNSVYIVTNNSDIILDADGGVYLGSSGADNAVVSLGYLNAALDNTTGSFVTTSSFNEYTASVTMSVSINTASLATTGSNTFIGNQTIDGTLTILTPSPGIPNSVSNWDGQGGWNQGFYSNVATTGGEGTGLTVDVAAGGGGYINIEAISINTPGSGYSNGDVITINNENNLPGTFTIGVEQSSGWAFDTYGSLTTPGNINVNGSTIINDGYLILTGSSVPTNLSGSIGDREGMVVFDDNYLYYCTSNFEPETYTIVVMPGTTYNTHVSIAKNQGIPALSSNGWSITTQDNTTYVLTGVYSAYDNWDCEIDNLNSTYNGGIQMMTLTNLNYAPADIWKRVSLNPASADIISSSAQITSLGFVSGSYLTSLDGAISSSTQLTASFDTRYAISASYLTSLNGVISGSSQLPTLATTGSNTFTGLQTFQQIQEVVSLKPTLGVGINNFDFNSGSIFYIAGLNGSGTWNVQNIPSASNSATSLTFVVQQGVTAYSASAYQLGGTAVAVKWLDAVAPTGSANSTDVIGLTAFRSGSSWNVIGSLSKFA